MSIFKSLKMRFYDAVKEHLLSVCLFLAAIIMLAIGEDDLPRRLGGNTLETIFTIIRDTLFGCSAGALLSEAIALGNTENKGNSVVLKSCLMAVFSVIVCQYSVITNANKIKTLLSEKYDLCRELSANFVIVALVAAACLVLYFFYKRGGEKFETYTAKAFCGLMKAELVYFIFSVGMALIILAFNALIFDTSRFDVLERVEILLIGLVQYPCILVGLGKTEKELGKFAKIVLCYIFTSLLAVSFVIIYLYIAKILITWKFPSNQVFSILAGVFCCGVFIWTMAQGAEEGVLSKAFRILPFFFVPFIILQIMCLYMRVKNYGFTQSRYMGLALIIFEIVYCLIYLASFLQKKDIMSASLFVVIAFSFMMLLMPVTNMYDVITFSQKKKIEAYIKSGDDATTRVKREAYEAYKTIKSYGGFSGNRFLNSRLSKEEIEKIKDFSSIPHESSDEDSFYANAYNANKEFDISGYSKIYVISNSFYDAEVKGTRVKDLKLYDEKGGELGHVDLERIIERVVFLSDSDAGEDEKTKELNVAIPLREGGILRLSYISVSGDKSKDEPYHNIDIDGYVLK